MCTVGVDNSSQQNEAVCLRKCVGKYTYTVDFHFVGKYQECTARYPLHAAAKRRQVQCLPSTGVPRYCALLEGRGVLRWIRLLCACIPTCRLTWKSSTLRSWTQALSWLSFLDWSSLLYPWKFVVYICVYYCDVYCAFASMENIVYRIGCLQMFCKKKRTV